MQSVVDEQQTVEVAQPGDQRCRCHDQGRQAQPSFGGLGERLRLVAHDGGVAGADGVVVVVVVVVMVVVVVVGASVVVVGGVVVGCVNPTPEVVVGSEYAVVVVVVVVEGSRTVPVVGVWVVVGSVLSCCPLHATPSAADNAMAAIPAARPAVDPTFITPPTSVFTMVTNSTTLRASMGLLESRAPGLRRWHTTQSRGAWRNGAAKCRVLRWILYMMTTCCPGTRLEAWQAARHVRHKGVNALSRTLFDNHPPLEVVARQSLRDVAAPARRFRPTALRAICHHQRSMNGVGSCTGCTAGPSGGGVLPR